MHQWNFWPFFQHGPVIEIWFFKQNCKIAYVLALPEDICAILMKFVIHILKALDISYWKMQEKVEIITNHILHFWTILDKNTQKRILWSDIGTLWYLSIWHFKNLFFPAAIRQRLLNRWTSQLDLGCTTGWLERVVSVHNST